MLGRCLLPAVLAATCSVSSAACALPVMLRHSEFSSTLQASMSFLTRLAVFVGPCKVNNAPLHDTGSVRK